MGESVYLDDIEYKWIRTRNVVDADVNHNSTFFQPRSFDKIGFTDGRYDNVRVSDLGTRSIKDIRTIVNPCVQFPLDSSCDDGTASLLRPSFGALT
jgi:hypothetical protein